VGLRYGCWQIVIKIIQVTVHVNHVVDDVFGGWDWDLSQLFHMSFSHQMGLEIG
jgi:hypothetical protein